MSEQFTKGPWFVVDDKKHNGFKVCEITKSCMIFSDVKPDDDATPDAALIAAAPEMYGMLSLLLTNSSFNVEHSDSADKIELILAKARGES